MNITSAAEGSRKLSPVKVRAKHYLKAAWQEFEIKILAFCVVGVPILMGVGYFTIWLLVNVFGTNGEELLHPTTIDTPLFLIGFTYVTIGTLCVIILSPLIAFIKSLLKKMRKITQTAKFYAEHDQNV